MTSVFTKVMINAENGLKEEKYAGSYCRLVRGADPRAKEEGYRGNYRDDDKNRRARGGGMGGYPRPAEDELGHGRETKFRELNLIYSKIPLSPFYDRGKEKADQS